VHPVLYAQDSYPTVHCEHSTQEAFFEGNKMTHSGISQQVSVVDKIGSFRMEILNTLERGDNAQRANTLSSAEIESIKH
jgi:hypothetical protein